jgi:hypothetical protein
VRVPVIHYPLHYSDRLFVLSAYFSLSSTDVVTSIHITFPFEAAFTKINRSFTSWVDVHPRTYSSVCRVDILGSLSFTQDRELNHNRFTDAPLSEEYLKFVRGKAIAINASHSLVAVEPVFAPRDETWTYGKCTMFEAEIRMRIPPIKVVVARSGIVSFLDGWTAYIAVTVPLMILAWMAMEAMYKTGFVPVHEYTEAEPNKEMTPKFNR